MPKTQDNAKNTDNILFTMLFFIFLFQINFYIPHKRNQLLCATGNNDFLKIKRSAGITVIEQKQEHTTPRALVRDNVRINVFTPSLRKRKGIAPATVVPVVAKRAGIFLLRAK
jgi:hypothetical protein